MAAAAGGVGAGGNKINYTYLKFLTKSGPEVIYQFLVDGKKIFKPELPSENNNKENYTGNYENYTGNYREPEPYYNDYNPAFIASFLEIFKNYDPTFEIVREDDADMEEGYEYSEYTLTITFPNDKDSLGVVFKKSVPMIQIYYNDSNGEVLVTFINFNDRMIPIIGKMIEDVYDVTPILVGPGPEPNNLEAMMAETLNRSKNSENTSNVIKTVENLAKKREALRFYKSKNPSPALNSKPIAKTDIMSLPSNVLKTIKKYAVNGGARRSTRRRKNKKQNSKKRKQTRRRA